MTRLSVNINKVATLRNARGEGIPDVERFAIDCEHYGAEGITVHPRPDERHITRADVYALRPILTTEFNIEGYPSEDFIKLVSEVKPAQVTLVPDAPDALTSSAGWDTIAHADFLRDVISRLKKEGIRVSVFTSTDADIIRKAKELGADRVELYTKPYADSYAEDREAAVAPFSEASRVADEVGLGVNAGHDLNLANLAFFVSHMPRLDEVSIGHAIISDALYMGIQATIKDYLDCLRPRGEHHK